MRESKFRGKRIDNDKWVYGDLIHCYGADAGRIFIKTFTGLYEVDPTTVGEYTGLKDKNDREIYEGDILTDKYESIGTVDWWNAGFVVNFGDVDIFQIADCFDESYQMWFIGNIHDNPELLK
mgnify:FL=1|jgi:uncharacterized phage protein (TIGR01671 family)